MKLGLELGGLLPPPSWPLAPLSIDKGLTLLYSSYLEHDEQRTGCICCIPDDAVRFQLAFLAPDLTD